MQRTITRTAARELDRRAIEEFGVPGIVLMENAGRSTTDVLCQQKLHGPVAVVCGRGNNAGDGFVIARHLDLRGHAVRVLLCDDPHLLTGDAAVNYQIVVRSGIAVQKMAGEQLPAALDGVAWIVDAILGTGARGAPRPPYDAIIDTLNITGVPILAVDIPSGLDCDTGEPSPHTIRAAHTCTFVAPKPGLLATAAADYVGHLHVVDIGAPRKLVESLLTP